jgi:hypothetical protein|tara:strand:- start:6810 stop:9011 length:2202 start_codon:yes stop_codon:yes gene_type:complete
MIELEDAPDKQVNEDLSNKKFTDWKNEPTLEDLKENYTDASSDKSAHVNNVNNWLDKLHVRNGAKMKASKTRSTVQPKLIRKQAEWRYPALSEPFLSTENIFTVEPVTFEDKQSAIQNSLILNNQFNTKINKVDFIDEYVRTAVEEGTVIVRVGWEYEEEINEVEVPVFEFIQSNDPNIIQAHQQLHELMQSNPEEFQNSVSPEMQQAHKLSMENNVPMEPVQVDIETEEQVTVLKNEPTLEVCDYKSMSIDPSCKGNLQKAGFVVFSFETSLSELKKEGDRYKNLDQINTNSSSILDADDSEADVSNFNFKDEPRKKFIAHEYWGLWDIEGTGKVKPIVATWVDGTIIRMEENPFPDQEHPFVKVQYLPVRKSNYGEPDGELLIENQNIIGAVTRGVIDIMGRSANGQVGSRKDALDITNKRKFDKGFDYEYNPSVGDPRTAFYMHTFPEVPRSAEYVLNAQNDDAEGLTGVKAFAGGLNGGSLGDSVGGIKSTLSASSKREIGILRRLSNGIIQIGRKFISMNAEFLSEEEVVRLSNDEFVPVRRDDLQGKVDLKLSISTAEDDAEKAQELSFMLQTTAQSMGNEFSQIILADIARLRKMPVLEKAIKEFQPQPDPMAQKKAELEIVLLEAQIANERSKAIENNAAARLDLARETTEGAKAENLNSDTDLKNLEFVEQETGTNQERNLQLSREQANANSQLKVLDSLLKPTPEGASKQRDDITVSNGLAGQ